MSVYLWTSRAASVLLAALALTLGTVTLAPRAASIDNEVVRIATPHSENCSSEQSIFVQDVNPRTGSHDTSYGTTSNIYVRTRLLDSACMDTAASWSMVNISDKSGSQAEIGYKQWAEPSGGFSFNIFACWQTPTGESCTPITGGPNPNAGNFTKFKVANDPVGSSTFVTWYNNNDGGGWHQFASGSEPFTNGVSEGETSRIGNSTGMDDHHKELQWKNSSSSWNDWNNQELDYTTVNSGDYFYHWMASNEYEICQHGGTCPWQ